MKEYNVESRRSYDEEFDNYIYGTVEAENEEEAIKLYKSLLRDMSEGELSLEELESYEYRAQEVDWR